MHKIFKNLQFILSKQLFLSKNIEYNRNHASLPYAKNISFVLLPWVGFFKLGWKNINLIKAGNQISIIKVKAVVLAGRFDLFSW